MAIGDDAQEAGMPIVPANGAPGSPGKVRQGNEEITRSRDFIAQGPTRWKPGTLLPVSKGGTGAGTPAEARTALGLEKSTSSAAAAGKVPEYNAAGQIAVGVPTSRGQATNKGYVDDAVAGATPPAFNGGTVTGQIFLPNSFAAASGYVVAYINADGRISRGASSSRYKQNITRECEIPDVFAAPIASYAMRQDPDNTIRYGYIAEDLAKHDGTAGFVVYDDEGRPDSFDMIGLLLAQVAQLNARVQQLEEAGHAPSTE